MKVQKFIKKMTCILLLIIMLCCIIGCNDKKNSATTVNQNDLQNNSTIISIKPYDTSDSEYVYITYDEITESSEKYEGYIISASGIVADAPPLESIGKGDGGAASSFELVLDTDDEAITVYYQNTEYEIIDNEKVCIEGMFMGLFEDPVRLYVDSPVIKKIK